MRIILPATVVLALAACAPPVPDSGKGVGFDSYTDYTRQRAEREGALAGGAGPKPATVSAETPQSATPTTVPPTTTAAATPAATSQPTIRTNSTAISDEQDFGAVSERETIESDAERLRAQRQQYKVIAPTALPSRAGSTGPNIVEFALSTTNRVGQPIYRRSRIFAEQRYNRNCARYPSPDLAQEDFLRLGGPKADRKGLDPDGDGFACSWDPQPFRNARG